jgi:hypothetical protein
MVVSDGDFLRTEASSEKLGIPELKVQLLRRAMTTLAQNMGSVKDIQAHLRHAKAIPLRTNAVHTSFTRKRAGDGRFDGPDAGQGRRRKARLSAKAMLQPSPFMKCNWSV